VTHPDNLAGIDIPQDTNILPGPKPATGESTNTSSAAHGDPFRKTELAVGDSTGFSFYTSSIPVLQDITIVDTPGTNAASPDCLNHTEATIRLLPFADLVLLVTSAERPLPESERKLLVDTLVRFRKDAAVIINKMDILDTLGGDHGSNEKNQLVDFVKQLVGEWMGQDRAVPVIPVSSRDAQTAKGKDTPGAVAPLSGGLLSRGVMSRLWVRSNFQELESYLRETLTTQEKLKGKLRSPLGAAEARVNECLVILENETIHLETDIATLQMLREQFSAWGDALSVETDLARNGMVELVNAIGHRGHSFNDAVPLYSLGWYHFVDPSRLHGAWCRTGEAALERGGAREFSTSGTSLETALLRLCDDIAERVATTGRAQGQAVVEFLGAAPSRRMAKSLVGNVLAVSRFEENRTRLLSELQITIRARFDTTEEVEKSWFLGKMKEAVYASTAAGAISVGCGLCAMIQLVELWSGLACSLLLSTATVLVLAVWRRRVADEFYRSWANRSDRLDCSLAQLFKTEVERVNVATQEAVRPYAAAVEAEQERLTCLTEECERFLRDADHLRRQIDRL
jgi:hypothetical protein